MNTTNPKWRAVVGIGQYGSWSQGGFATVVEASVEALNYIIDHPGPDYTFIGAERENDSSSGSPTSQAPK